jgi:hypothetical protein
MLSSLSKDGSLNSQREREIHFGFQERATVEFMFHIYPGKSINIIFKPRLKATKTP